MKRHHSTPPRIIIDDMDKKLDNSETSSFCGSDSSEFNAFADQPMALVKLTCREFGIKTIFDEHSTTIPMPFFAKLTDELEKLHRS